MRACVHACVRARVRACVRAGVRAGGCAGGRAGVRSGEQAAHSLLQRGESIYCREGNRSALPRPRLASIWEQEPFAGVVELDEILSAIRTFNDNSDFITGQRGRNLTRKRELGSPPIAIKTATDEFLVLQLNAPRIVGGVIRRFVHQPKQC